MEQDEREDLAGIIEAHGLNENGFEITESTAYPTTGVGPLSGTVTIKCNMSGIEKNYRLFGNAWIQEFERDLKSNYYKVRH